MTDVYRRLARKLDEMPNGFPSTEDGTELRILRKIFSPEEAEMALKVKPVGETIEAIAHRLGMTVAELQPILDNMVRKGQLFSFPLFEQKMYVLPPFVPGILEFQLNRLDKELAELMEEYRPVLLKSLGSIEPPIFRVLPIQARIDAKAQIYPYEDIRQLMEEATSFNVMECLCRKERALVGHPCTHSLEVCLGFSKQEHMFDDYPLGRRISKQEALGILAKAEEEGLVHNTFNVEQEPVFICNCCPCCCGILQAVRAAQIPHMLATSSFVAEIDQDSCTLCGICAEERCPVGAILEHHGTYKVLGEQCIGCGVCTPTCPTESIRLVRKPASAHVKPPAHMVEWNLARAASRGIELKFA